MMEAVMFGCKPRGAELLHTRLTGLHRKGQTLRPTESIIRRVRIASRPVRTDTFLDNMSYRVRGVSSRASILASQLAAVKKLMSPATNSQGEVVYAYPYIPGTETQWEAGTTTAQPGQGGLRDLLMPSSPANSSSTLWMNGCGRSWTRLSLILTGNPQRLGGHDGFTMRSPSIFAPPRIGAERYCCGMAGPMAPLGRLLLSATTRES